MAATGASQINITNHAAVMPLILATAVRNFLAQIRQPHIGSVTLNQILFSILSRASAFRTRQAYRVGWVFVELERAGHLVVKSRE
jgi:hypothetical protein